MPKLEMSEIEIFTTVVIFISAIGITLFFFWQYRRLEREVLEEKSFASDVQEANVIVAKGFQPAYVLVKVGRPVRLNFTRRQTSDCGEEVIIPAFDLRAHLPVDETIKVELTPRQPGEYEFTCDKNVCRGTLVVEAN
jgi:plastocyanin domain-containing protein